MLFFWILLFPYHTIAQTVAPAPIVTPTEAPTPAITSTPGPSATPEPTAATTFSTSDSTPTTVPQPTLEQTTNTQSSGVGGNGLVDEKENDTGLGYADDNALGATTPQTVSSSGDKDLLTTLIFLTAAVILVVWTTYIILIQKGIIKSGIQKNKHTGGITPQPLT